ncbi:hypothetical protein L6164_002832 [Bauhinia variegata]|uniref:Uncharacterized protein n=1 Tax=Bauhinia variegata TaxID=167791 RepID=A0ACB9Q1J3_BAUVA|nr:hypothetical protein L6164_002832 [Bauhinia variegata]
MDDYLGLDVISNLSRFIIEIILIKAKAANERSGSNPHYIEKMEIQMGYRQSTLFLFLSRSYIEELVQELDGGVTLEKQKLHQVVLQHTFGEGNRVAHGLAKNARLKQEEQVIFYEVPTFVNLLYFADTMGITTRRLCNGNF